jgi:hypothetical protein
MFRCKSLPIGRRRREINNGGRDQSLLVEGRYKIGQGHEARWDPLPQRRSSCEWVASARARRGVCLSSMLHTSFMLRVVVVSVQRAYQEGYSIAWTCRMESETIA